MTLAVLLAAGCATVGVDDAVWIVTDDGQLRTEPRGCPPRDPPSTTVAPLPSDRPLTLVSWNIHKAADEGWDRDLARFAAGADIVLLQEAVLSVALRDTLLRERLIWMQADAWRGRTDVTGVLTAARAPATAACVSRALEPLLGVPKSALVTYYRLAGRRHTLAVANVHSVNFSLALGGYRDQLEAVAAVLASHQGPIVLCRRLQYVEPRARRCPRRRRRKTWPRARRSSRRRPHPVRRHALRLCLCARLRAGGVRVEPVTSSDHAPLIVTLALSPEPR
jgi:endonuclease/exonuclease/phosphatase (EEP) superfamily protein YafD